MERFIRRENIKRYRKLLREPRDEPGRRLIQIIDGGRAKRGDGSPTLATDSALAPSLAPVRADIGRLEMSRRSGPSLCFMRYQGAALIQNDSDLP